MLGRCGREGDEEKLRPTEEQEEECREWGAGRRGSEGCGAQLRVLGPREAFRGAL